MIPILTLTVLLTLPSVPALAQNQGAEPVPRRPSETTHPPAPETRPIEVGAVGMILGRPVVDSQGTAVGRLVDFVVSLAGEPLAGVVDVGGFMGIGMHRVAIAWPLLRFRREAGEVQVVVTLLLEEIAAGPAWRGLDGGAVLVGKPKPEARP
jgi:hypothetical protein